MTLKLTLKQLMLIIMSVLLVLTVTMSVIVVVKVSNVVRAMGGPAVNQPVAGTNPSGTEDPNQNKDTEPNPTESKAPTKPKETDPDHEHEYVKSQTVAATCTDMGYTIYLCDCGKNDIRDFHEARGHNYGEEERLDATCETPGYRQATCLRCGAVDTREVFDALDHNFQLAKKQELTCVLDGYEEYKCANCGEIKRENEQKAQGHKWKKPSQIVKEPTDVAPGEELKTCEACKDTETVLIAPTGTVEVQSSGSSTQGDWKAYVFYVGTENNKSAYIYRVWIAAEHSDVEAVFAMSGLTVTYRDGKGAKQQQILKPYSNEILTIDEDGKLSYEAPDLSQEETQEPTQGTTQEPTEESTQGSTQEPTEESTQGSTQEPTGDSGNA